jgi:hypothetical protein
MEEQRHNACIMCNILRHARKYVVNAVCTYNSFELHTRCWWFKPAHPQNVKSLFSRRRELSPRTSQLLMCAHRTLLSFALLSIAGLHRSEATLSRKRKKQIPVTTNHGTISMDCKSHFTNTRENRTIRPCHCFSMTYQLRCQYRRRRPQDPLP